MRLGQVGVLAQREGHVLEHRQVGEQRAELEQHAQAAAQAVQLRAGRACRRPRRRRPRGPCRRACTPPIRRSSVVLPQPEPPRIGRDLAARELQRHVVQDRPAGVVAEGDVVDLDEGVRRSSGCRARARVSQRQSLAWKAPDSRMHRANPHARRPRECTLCGTRARAGAAASARQRARRPSGTRPPRAPPGGLRGSPTPPATGRAACRRRRTPCRRWSCSRPAPSVCALALPRASLLDAEGLEHAWPPG